MSKKSESNAEAADLFLTEKKHAQCCFFKLKLKVLELEVWWSTFFHHFTRANVIKAVKWFSVTQILCAQAGYNCHSDEEIKICATAEDQENWDSISREAYHEHPVYNSTWEERQKKRKIPHCLDHYTQSQPLWSDYSDGWCQQLSCSTNRPQQSTLRVIPAFCLFFIAPTTSLWGLMGNYKIKNIKNLENLHTVFMNFTAANKILFY